MEFRSEMKAGKLLLTRQAIPAEAVHTGSKESHRKRNVLLGIIIAFVVVIAIAAAVSTLKPNLPNPCVFSSQSFAVSSDGSKSLKGCLTSGSYGSWEFAIACHPCSPTMSGTVSSTYPVDVEILQAGLPGHFLYSRNDTTSASFSGIQLAGEFGYNVIVDNRGGQNNSISAAFQFGGF